MLWDATEGALRRTDGTRFDGIAWRWVADEDAPRERPAAETVTAREALVRLAALSRLRPVPVGVIGPRAASHTQAATAEALGRALAQMGLPVLCGGKTGVMDAVARGVTDAGGLCIGLLPEGDWREGNAHVLPIATGIGKARNVLIAQASRALIAVGGELGTLTEIAFGLHFDKPVFLIEGAPEVAGARRMADLDTLCEGLAAALLGADPA